MKILILAVHFEVTGARYIADAFTRLGHDVKHVGNLAKLRDAWGVDVPEKYIWKTSEVDLSNWKPDLIIAADTEVSTWQFFNPRSGLSGIPVIRWIQDNHVRNVREEGIAHYFLAHAHGQSQPVTHDDETWLPCAADTTVFTPSTIPWAEREFDVCLIGVMYPQRVKLIERLRAEGFKVFAATGLVYEEYQQAYANSRISLCVSAAGDVAQRIFETAAIGCLVLTDHLYDLDDEVTNRQLGLQGFSCYADDDEAVMQCKRWLRGEYDPTDIESAKAAARQLQAIVRESHTWDKRAQVVVDWFNKEYGVSESVNPTKLILHGTPDYPLMKMYADAVKVVEATNQKGLNTLEASEVSIDVLGHDNDTKAKPFLNLGCGKTHLPSAKPAGHEAVDDAIYSYPLWVNVDKVEGVGADKTFDLFTYPWPLEDNSFDGALCCHILEHIGHEIKSNNRLQAELTLASINGKEEGLRRFTKRFDYLKSLQDGWYAFFSELYRVLTPGATVHVVSPYGWSDGGITDPSHTRYLTLNTFTHSMTPEISDGSTFKYNNGGINFQIDGSPLYRIAPMYSHIRDQEELQQLMMTRLNVVYDFYVKLKVVK